MTTPPVPDTVSLTELHRHRALVRTSADLRRRRQPHLARAGREPGLLAGRWPHLAERPAHAAVALVHLRGHAARTGGPPGAGGRAFPAHPRGLHGRRPRCRDGSPHLARQRPGQHLRCRAPPARAGGHRAARDRGLPVRHRPGRLLRRVPVARLQRRRRAHRGVRHRLRPGLLDAGGLRQRLRQCFHGQAHRLSRGGLSFHGRRGLPRGGPPGRPVGRPRTRPPPFPARPLGAPGGPQRGATDIRGEPPAGRRQALPRGRAHRHFRQLQCGAPT